MSVFIYFSYMNILGQMYQNIFKMQSKSKFIRWYISPDILWPFGELKPPCRRIGTTQYFLLTVLLLVSQNLPCRTIGNILLDDWNQLVPKHEEAAPGSGFISPTWRFKLSDKMVQIFQQNLAIRAITTPF